MGPYMKTDQCYMPYQHNGGSKKHRIVLIDPPKSFEQYLASMIKALNKLGTDGTCLHMRRAIHENPEEASHPAVKDWKHFLYEEQGKVAAFTTSIPHGPGSFGQSN